MQMSCFLCLVSHLQADHILKEIPQGMRLNHLREQFLLNSDLLPHTLHFHILLCKCQSICKSWVRIWQSGYYHLHCKSALTKTSLISWVASKRASLFVQIFVYTRLLLWTLCRVSITSTAYKKKVEFHHPRKRILWHDLKSSIAKQRRIRCRYNIDSKKNLLIVLRGWLISSISHPPSLIICRNP